MRRIEDLLREKPMSIEELASYLPHSNEFDSTQLAAALVKQNRIEARGSESGRPVPKYHVVTKIMISPDVRTGNLVSMVFMSILNPFQKPYEPGSSVNIQRLPRRGHSRLEQTRNKWLSFTMNSGSSYGQNDRAEQSKAVPGRREHSACMLGLPREDR